MTRDESKPMETLRQFSQSLDRVLRSRSPEAVHNLRTRSRRLEAALRAILGEDDPSARSLLKTATRLRKWAGHVRDLDVLAGFTCQLAGSGKQESLAQLAEHLSAQRKRAARRLKTTVSTREQATRRALKQCRKLLKSEGQQEQVETAAEKHQRSLAASSHPDAANLHDYRIRLKELRYTLELSPGSDEEFFASLVEAIGAIGEWHDWSELQALAADLLRGAAHRDLLDAIRTNAEAKLRNALPLATALHQRYFSKAAAR